ncbi:MAG: hypothetical protein KF878_22985 [Planctomycetes bacterium]|nr:hypothetical protein [Planctomycetota bacterium]
MSLPSDDLPDEPPQTAGDAGDSGAAGEVFRDLVDRGPARDEDDDGDQVILDLRPSAGKPRDLSPADRRVLPGWWPCCFMGGLFVVALTLMTLGSLYKDPIYSRLLSPEDRLGEAGSLIELGRQREVEAERTGSPLALEQALDAYERALIYVPEHPPALEGIDRVRAALGRGAVPVEAPGPGRR